MMAAAVQYGGGAARTDPHSQQRSGGGDRLLQRNHHRCGGGRSQRVDGAPIGLRPGCLSSKYPPGVDWQPVHRTLPSAASAPAATTATPKKTPAWRHGGGGQSSAQRCHVMVY
eukprot:Filipodium_phascolosomae@DN4246_c0_g1_i1.p2